VFSRFSTAFVFVTGALLASSLAMQLHAEERDAKPRFAAAINPKSASPEDIQKWIGQLSDDSFSIRQAAADRLLAAGTPAREALAEIAKGPEPEARAAARRLVALIDRTEFNRRLEAFAADTDGKRGLTLPGWDRYREMVGNDPAARALFVEMQRAEGPLIAAVFGVSSRPPEQWWEERLSRLLSWQGVAANRAAMPPLGSCAAIVFLGSVPELEVSDRGALFVENLITRPPIAEALAADAPQEAVRRLVGSWLLHCPNDNETILERRLQLMIVMNVKDALSLALGVATGDEKKYANVRPTTRAAAVLAVGQFGGKEHAARLEPLLDDNSVCMPLQAPQQGQRVTNVQVRDVALCVMLHLTGQKPSDYGYLHAQSSPQQVFHLHTLHVASDDVRADAAAKWKKWRAAREDRGSRVESREPEKAAD
jgi:hypothetical protein